MMKNIGQYEYNTDDWLGGGSFAEVYKGTNIITKETVAIKEININRIQSKNHGLDNDKILKCLSAEITTMKQLNHKNILQLRDVIIEDQVVYMVVEYCSGGDIVMHMKAQKKSHNIGMDERIIHQIAVQLADGIKFMHSKGIIHRDLKPQNILLQRTLPKSTKDFNGLEIKIADFGFARTLTSSELTETICGSPLYMAPEVLQRHKYSDNTDLWSLGVILYEMVVGCTPYPAKNIIELCRAYEIAKEINIPSYINASFECRDLISSLLVIDPKKRITWEDFSNHEWIKKEKIGSSPPVEIETQRSETYIGSAPARLQTAVQMKPKTSMFEIIDINTNKVIYIDKSNKLLEDEEMIIEIKKWLDRVNTLSNIVEMYDKIRYYAENYALCQHICSTSSIVIKTVNNYISRKYQISLAPDKQNNLFEMEFFSENGIVYEINKLLIQMKKISDKQSDKIKYYFGKIEQGKYCKPLPKLLMDISMSNGKQGKVYNEMEDYKTSCEKYQIAINVLETLLPISDANDRTSISKYISLYIRKKMHIEKNLISK